MNLSADGLSASAASTDSATTQHWDAVHVETVAPTNSQVTRLNNREDTLMGDNSPDRRPPTHAQRIAGRWIICAAGVAIVLALSTWAIISGVSLFESIGFVIAFVLALFLGGWPVYAAQFGRRKDQAVAHADAVGATVPLRTSADGKVVHSTKSAIDAAQ